MQSHRQTGLSTVCDELLSFFGNEIYIRREPALTGATFGEALSRYELGVPIGIHRGDGRAQVNPAMDTVIGAEDDVIVIAEDDLLIRLTEDEAEVRSSALVSSPGRAAVPDRTLMIGWNSRAPKIITLLDQLVRPGSVIDIASPSRPDEAVEAGRAHLTVGHKVCEPTSRRSLESLDLGGYQHIIVLSDESVGPDLADDRTLVTLLHLRDIEVGLGDPYSIVTEMNDDANREVAQVTKADDFIVSTKLICLLLTQLAENGALYEVLADLFDPAGSEIYLKPAGDYLRPDTEANFATVLEAARRRGETAIGYRVAAHGDRAPRYGVHLNPPRSEPLVLGGSDHVIVLAEN